VRDLQGFWAGVGGWVDPGETPEQAVVREVREELGVGAEVIRHLRPFIAWHVAQLDDPVSFLLFPHRVRLTSTEFRPDPAEVTGVAWAAPGDLGGYPMLPYVKGLLDERLEEWLTEP
jgi:8-oxo-dGTP diphosphatase